MNEGEITRIVSDLRSFSAELAEQVGGPTLVVPALQRQDRTSFAARNTATTVVRLVRAAAAEIEQSEVQSERATYLAAVPRGAIGTCLPRDWRQHQSRWLPTRWQVPAFEVTPDLATARWLTYCAELASDYFARRLERIGPWVEDAKAARVVGNSVWAEEAAVALEALRIEADADRASCRRLLSDLGRLIGKRVTPQNRFPEPFPSGRVWRDLRQHVANLSAPHRMLRETVSAALRQPISVCDLPVLYQRWVGIQLLKAFERSGWTVVNDPVGAMWLGGTIELTKEDRRAKLLVENRFAARVERHGLECVRGESLTPDFCICFESFRGPCTWILDATLSGNADITASKQSKYLAGLRQSEPSFIAGVPVYLGPMRSWVACPLRGTAVVLNDSDGSRGILSVNPAADIQPALDAWVGDLGVYA